MLKGETMAKREKRDLSEDVVFRVWIDEPYSVIALWPAVPADNYDGNCNSYEHVGQHGGADYAGVISRTRPAAKYEYANLLAELKRIGYKPHVITRSTSAHRLARHIAAGY
jgi:hypothetical protein